MNLNVDEWKEFKFGDLISRPYKAKAFNKDDLEVTEKNGIRYITRTGINNGCEMIVDATTIPQQYIEKGNAISIGDTTATCFYQDEDFITGDHMVVVRAEWLNKANGLFIASMLQNEQYKYSYGRAFLIDRIQETRIKLPVQHNQDGTPYIEPDCTYSEEGYVPDWQFMEDYIKSLHHKPLTTKNAVGNALALKVDEWKEFYIGKLFNIYRGKTLSSENKEEYAGNKYSCINGGSVDNGELCKLSEDLQEIGFALQEVPSLSLSRVGNAGLTFLQTEPYYIADNAFSLVLKKQKNTLNLRKLLL